jgi:hypothetical protein
VQTVARVVEADCGPAARAQQPQTTPFPVWPSPSIDFPKSRSSSQTRQRRESFRKRRPRALVPLDNCTVVGKEGALAASRRLLNLKIVQLSSAELEVWTLFTCSEAVNLQQRSTGGVAAGSEYTTLAGSRPTVSIETETMPCRRLSSPEMVPKPRSANNCRGRQGEAPGVTVRTTTPRHPPCLNSARRHSGVRRLTLECQSHVITHCS